MEEQGLDKAPQAGLEEFVNDFCLDRQKETQELKNFLVNKDFESIRRMAHKWKGFCDPYGYHQLTQLSLKLEQASKEENLGLVGELISQIDEYLQKKATELGI